MSASRSPQTNSSFYRMIAARGEGVLVESFMIKRPSVGQRMVAGKALRKHVPRAAQSIYEKRTDRPDPVEILERQSATRVQKLVPVRYGRMLASPFAFLRGSAAIMASDLSRLPITGTRVAACGDAHVKNFGVYASAERNLVFSINDFDEVYVGPWEWDLKRLAASAVVATQFMGGNKAQSEQAARQCGTEGTPDRLRHHRQSAAHPPAREINATGEWHTPLHRRRSINRARNTKRVRCSNKADARPFSTRLHRLVGLRSQGAAVALSNCRFRPQSGRRRKCRHEMLGAPTTGHRW